MGYQITFAPTEEKMKDYKPWNVDEAKKKNYDDELANPKREIINYCLKDHENDSVYTMANSLTYAVRHLWSVVESLEKESAYFRWLGDEDKELYYCGWEFARDSTFEKDDFIRDSVDKLLVFASIIKTPDYFDNSEKFYDKWNEIKEELDGMVDIFQDICIHNIIDNLSEFEIKYDDDGNVIAPANAVEKESHEDEEKPICENKSKKK